MRRVGKSYLLRQVMVDLHNRGLPQERILYINKESLDFDELQTYKHLHEHVQRKCPADGTPRCICVDEVQEIASWQKAIVSLAGEPATDVYISGSNARLLSGDLATSLAGRYVEIPVYALTFREFLQFRAANDQPVRDEFQRYARYGGLPAIHHLEFTDETIFQYISSLYNTVLLKDVIARHEVRNVSLLERLSRYLFDCVGTEFSANSIANFLKNQRVKASVETVQNYVSFLLSALVLHRVGRYDIRGKRHLETSEKYYLEDIGMRHALLGFREGSLAAVLENLVYHELRARRYSVSIGRVGSTEVDFVAEKEGVRCYMQVAYLLQSDDTVAREFGALRAIRDNYPKYVITMDDAWGDEVDGIRRLNLVEWLRDPKASPV
ncbi:MAG: AAA family ATPase [Chitinivibrionales bacterium]|nr:AAA family ATPase [Chitinivibrionales bacterium]